MIMWKFLNIFRNKENIKCKDCKNKVQIGKERYLCLINDCLVTDYGKCCSKYNK